MSSNKVRIIWGKYYYRGHFVCVNLRALCSMYSSNFPTLYIELLNTGQLDKPVWVDRYYLYFNREYPVDKVAIDNIAICKECWKDFLLYRLAREGIQWADD